MKQRILLSALALTAAISMSAGGMVMTANASTSPHESIRTSTSLIDEIGNHSIVYEQVKKDGTVICSIDGGGTCGL